MSTMHCTMLKVANVQWP